jgi:dihydroneopterin aldolase|tara:strand:+ start:567 stop:935 length:369 start_codon:yes stop_codon:yes gene_type:complete
LSKKIHYSLKLVDINLFGHHGLYKKEKERGQNFIINIDVNYYPLNTIDNINSYINYIYFYDFIKERFNDVRYDTLEGLINKLIIDIEKNFQSIFYIKLSIKKPELYYDTNQNFIKVERESIK